MVRIHDGSQFAAKTETLIVGLRHAQLLVVDKDIAALVDVGVVVFGVDVPVGVGEGLELFHFGFGDSGREKLSLGSLVLLAQCRRGAGLAGARLAGARLA